jgi:glycosyltransferase involved in cell wall biosynthesis
LQKELNIIEKFVIIHIGRFEAQKNHTFLIDVFNSIQKRDNNSVLLLIGVGSLMDDIKERVRSYGLCECVKFLNNRDDIANLFQAADVLLLPSLYEGLPVVSIEAQASGIPCVLSDTITKESDITGNCIFQSLNSSPDDWADQVFLLKDYNRVSTINKIKRAGYDIHEQAMRLQDFYLNAN